MEINSLGNVEIKEDHVVFTINPKIYPLDVVYSACYVMLDDAYIFLDGDPEQLIKIEIRKKKPEQDVKQLLYQLNEQLLSYAQYKVQSEKNKAIRELLLHRALFTNAPGVVKRKLEEKEANEEVKEKLENQQANEETEKEEEKEEKDDKGNSE